MPEPGEHRHTRRSDRQCDGFGVEQRELGARAPTADDHEDVDVGAPAERGDCGTHHCLGEISLHAHVHDPDSESMTTVLQLVHEVVPSRTVDARDEADAQRHHRHRVATVRVVQTGGHQAANQFFAFQSHLSERVARVDAAHLQAQPAVGRVVVEYAVHAHLHAVGEEQPVALQQRAQAHADVGEERHVENRAPITTGLHELEVGMPVLLVVSLDLTPHPETITELSTQRPVHGVSELADGVRRLTSVVELEIERGLAHAPSLP